jgi:hypothetical protein
MGRYPHDLDFFIEQLRETFGDPDEQLTAQQRLNKMKQERGQRMEDFVIEFRQQARRSGYNDIALMDIFKRSIHPKILEKLYGSQYQANSLEELYGMSTRFDNLWREYQHFTGSNTGNMTRHIPYQPKPAPKTAFKDATGTTYTGSGQPMEIGRQKGGKTCFYCGIKGHVAAVCKQKLGGCFKCKQKGHAIKDCPQNTGQKQVRGIETWQQEVQPGSYREPPSANTSQYGGRSIQGDGRGHIGPIIEEQTEEESVKDHAQ